MQTDKHAAYNLLGAGVGSGVGLIEEPCVAFHTNIVIIPTIMSNMNQRTSLSVAIRRMNARMRRRGAARTHCVDEGR